MVMAQSEAARIRARRAAARPRPFNTVLKVVVVTVVVLGGLWLFASYQLRSQVDKLIANPFLKLYAELRYSDAFLWPNGDISINRIEISPTAGGAISIERLTWHTPGLIWLFQTAVLKQQVTPQKMGLSIDGVSLIGVDLGDELSTVGLISQIPFEAAGCGEYRAFGPGELISMGLPSPRLAMRFDYDASNPTAARVSGRSTAAGIAAIEYEARGRFDGAPAISSLEMRFVDTGFVAARNEFCAEQGKQSVAAFAREHQAAVRNELALAGLAVSDDALSAYFEFAVRGGELALVSRSSQPVNLAELAGQAMVSGQAPDPWALIRALNLGLSIGSRTAVALNLRQVAPSGKRAPRTLAEQVQAEIDAEREALLGGPVATDDSPAAADDDGLQTDEDSELSIADIEQPEVVTGAPIAPREAPSTVREGNVTRTTFDIRDSDRIASGAVAPERNRDLSYGDLNSRIGRRVRIDTRMGRQHIGVVERVGEFEVEIRVSTGVGSAVYKVRRDTIKRISAP